MTSKTTRLSGLYKILLVLTLCYIMGAVIYKTGVLQQVIKTRVELALSKAFRREIKAESLSGSLFTQLLLSNVKIASEDTVDNGVLLDLKSLNAKIDIFKMVSRGSFLAGIEVVNLVDGTMHVERIKDDAWNLLDFAIPPKRKPGTRSKNKFRGKIYITNVSGQFIDKKGWGINELEQPFVEPFTEVSGYMDFSEFESVPMQFTAKVQSSKTPVSVTGILDGYMGYFDLYLNIAELDANKWGPYIIPVKSVRISQDQLNVRGHLMKHLEHEGEMVFSVITSFENLKFELPKLAYPIQDLSGEFEFTNKGGKQLKLSNLEGRVHHNPLRASGRIYLKDRRYAVRIEMAEAGFKQFLENFPFINQKIPYVGTAKGFLDLTGPLTKPRFQGEFQLDGVGLHKIGVSDQTIKVSLMDEQFKFWSQNQDTVSGRVDFKPQYPEIYVNLDLKKVSVDVGVEDLESVLVNHPMAVSMVLHGDTRVLDLDGEINPSQTVVLGQEINKVQFQGQLKKMSHLILPAVNINGKNGLSLYGSLEMIPGQSYRYDLLQNEGGESQTAKIEAHFKGEGSLVPGERNRLFQHQAAISFQQKGGFFGVQKVDSIKTKLVLDSDKLQVKQFSFQRDKKEVSLSATHYKDKSGDLSVSLTDLNPDHLIKWLDPGQLNTEDKLGNINASFKIDYKEWVDVRTHPVTYDGHLDLELGPSIIQDQKIDQLQLSAAFSEQHIDASQLKLVTGKSVLDAGFKLLYGDVLDIHLKQDTVLQLSDINTDYNPFPEWDAEISLEGEIRYTYQGNWVRSDLDFDVSTLVTPFATIDTITGSLFLNRQSLDLKNTKIKQGESEINIQLSLPDFLKEGQLDINDIEQQPFLLNAGISDLSLEATYQQWVLWKTINKDTKKIEDWQQITARSVRNKDNRILIHRLEGSEYKSFAKDVDYWSEKLNDDQQKNNLNLQGVLNGELALRKEKWADIQINAIFDITALSAVGIDAKNTNVKVDSTTDWITIQTQSTDMMYHQKPVKELHTKTHYNPKRGVLNISDSDVLIDRKWHRNVVLGDIPIRCISQKNCESETVALSFMVSKQSSDLWELLSPKDIQVRNQGDLDLTLKGPVPAPILNGYIALDKVRVSSTKKNSQQSISIPNALITASNNQITLPQTKIIVSYLKSITDRPSSSHLNVSVEARLEQIDLQHRNLKLYTVTHFDAKTLRFDLPNVQNATISDLDLQLEGPLVFPVSKESQFYPLLRGRARIETAEIRVGTKQKTGLPNMNLELDLEFEPNVVISGGLFGGGAFSFANNFYFETEKSKIKIEGSSTLPVMKSGLKIKDGAISLFDSYYELVNEEDQRYFQVASNLEKKPNQARLQSRVIAGTPTVVPVLTITAVNYIPVSRLESDESLSGQTGYQTVMLRIDGPLSDLEESLDLAIFSMSSTYPKNAQISLQQFFRQPLLQSTNEREQSDALSYITPTALKSNNSESVETIGEQQTNVLFRKTISPIERRIAKKTGLYDLKVDYNLGRNLRNRLGDSASDKQEENLLGVNFIWGLLSDRLLLRLKTDIDTNTQTPRSGQLKLTEFELTYLFTQQLSANLTHVSEYRELSEFEPLLSVSFLQRF